MTISCRNGSVKQAVFAIERQRNRNLRATFWSCRALPPLTDGCDHYHGSRLAANVCCAIMSESSQGEKQSLGSVLRDWLCHFGRKRSPLTPAVRRAQFRLTYSRFREILTLNDGILRTISEFEDKATGQEPFALHPLLGKLRQAELNAALIAKNLNQIAGGQQYSGLYDALGRIQERIASVVDRHIGLPDGPLILPLDEARRECALLAGSKAAALGELRAALRLAVPDGFVVTTSAFSLMLRAAGQSAEASTLEGVLEQSGREALELACRRVRDGILNTTPPAEVLDAISRACQLHFAARRNPRLPCGAAQSVKTPPLPMPASTSPGWMCPVKSWRLPGAKWSQALSRLMRLPIATFEALPLSTRPWRFWFFAC